MGELASRLDGMLRNTAGNLEGLAVMLISDEVPQGLTEVYMEGAACALRLHAGVRR
jgi:hypothetical protein